VDDNEPKYGLAVTGIVHPDKILTNCRVQAGDVLILTKPLGTGVLFNACRSKKLPFRDLEVILPQIAGLNKKALDTALNFDIHSCTDITGFGIIGHTLEMATGSGIQIDLFYNKLPFYPHAVEMYRKGETTGSNKANRKLSDGHLEVVMEISRGEEELLFDPQTSGGLLLSVPESQGEQLVSELRTAGVETAAIIGNAIYSPVPRIRVL
jgi:selenide,water dikinase